MNIIKKITDENLGLVSIKNLTPKLRTASSGIVVDANGKIAIINEINKNEYKLPGGGIEKGESEEETFIREVHEETGCKVKITDQLGIVEEFRTHKNFKQISYIYVGEVIKKGKKLNLTDNEKASNSKLIWVNPEEGLRLITECIDKLKTENEDDLYHCKFISIRDKAILEHYLNSKNNFWNSLYKKYINEEFKNWNEYYKTKMKLKKSFIKLVIKYSKNGKPVLECGCGTGKTSIYLSKLGLKTYAMDMEKAMIIQTKNLSKKICPLNQVKVIHGNINNIPYKNKYFSVTHSSGVLEHYSDDEIIQMINEQLRVSDYCIFSVPTTYFEKKMLGNERFMKRKEWEKIILKSNGIIIKNSGYHYKTFDKRILDIIKKPIRLFKPIALYTFVLKER